MPQVEIYTKNWCGYCRAAKVLLNQAGYGFIEIDVTEDMQRFEEMLLRADGRRTVPQIFFDGVGIGGYRELSLLAKAGQLPG